MVSAVFVAFPLTAGDVAGTGEVAGVGVMGFREIQGRLAGDGDAALGDSAAAAFADVASFFLERFCLAGLGEAAAAGDSAATAVAAGDAAFFLECFAFAGLGDASAVAAGVGL